ncbi:hypothetical protein GUJ93_ZPchr0013g36935 [Zizania palustris]|uniref:Uncharacterized protein n=1 Tax=Zizania palustris TaxID=103762 RepID=A0A8J6BX11_ZIZPA|nr:hypothetical protein GUJ93_ZPchr0013g36935 [Zizania palustris]
MATTTGKPGNEDQRVEQKGLALRCVIMEANWLEGELASRGRAGGAHGGRRGGGAVESGGKGRGKEEARRGEARRIPAGRRRGGSRRGGVRRSPAGRVTTESDGVSRGGGRRRGSRRGRGGSRPGGRLADPGGEGSGGSRRGGARWRPLVSVAAEATGVGHGGGRRQVEQRALFGVRKMNQGGRKLKKVGHVLL